MKRLACTLIVAAACGGDTNVAGDYTIAITNRDNGCSIGNWTVGAQPIATATVMQEGSNVTLNVDGLAAVALVALLGTNQFQGKVDGDDVTLTATGTAAMNNGNCAYTYNSTVDASMDGDTLKGRIDYRAATNGGSDCGTRTDCRSFQDFNAVRSPQ